MISTPRLSLFLPLYSDAQRVLDYQERNRDFFGPWSPPLPEDFWTIEYWQDALELFRKENKEGRALRLFLIPKNEASGPIIGECHFTQISRGPFQACYLGYNLDEQYTRRGYMTEALDSAIDYLFETMELHRVMANYCPENKASARLLQKLSFEIEGYARDYLFINGEWRDHVLTSRINPFLEVPKQ